MANTGSPLLDKVRTTVNLSFSVFNLAARPPVKLSLPSPTSYVQREQEGIDAK